MAESEITIKLPNHLTMDELIASGKSAPEAKKILAGRVFGTDHKMDAAGKPIEQGIGSEANPFKATHEAALKVAKDRESMTRGGGTSDVISAAIAAGIELAMSKQKQKETF